MTMKIRKLIKQSQSSGERKHFNFFKDTRFLKNMKVEAGVSKLKKMDKHLINRDSKRRGRSYLHLKAGF